MKGKILSILFCLVLVFGMIFAACDNGVAPENKSEAGKKVILDFSKNSEDGVNGVLFPSDDGGDEGGDDGDDD